MADKLRLDVELSINSKQLDQESRNIIRKARALDRAFNSVDSKGLNRMGKVLRASSVSIDRLGLNAGKAATAMNDLGVKSKLTARNFIVYNVIAGFFFRLTGAIREGVGAFVKFDAALNRAEQILNPLTSNMQDLRRAVFELGGEFGVTVQSVQDAQEVFIRQGLSLQDSIKLTRASLALSAATAIDAAQATEALTSVMRQFNIEASKAILITDKLTAVSINFAVTSTDLFEGINRAGSAAATVGVKFEELTGFIAAAQEATRRGGRVIGTGLRTIFARIFRAPAIEAMQELGIQTRETSGQFKTASALLTELAGKFQTMNRTQQIAIASTISGQRQIATLLALLRNWERATDAITTAQNAQGTASELTRKRQESLEVQIQRIVNQFVKFGTAIGAIVSDDALNFIRIFSDALEGIGDLFSKLDGGPLKGIVNTLAKIVALNALQALGVGKLIAGTVTRLKLLTSESSIIRSIVGVESRRAATNRRLVLENGKLKLSSAGRVALTKDELQLEQQKLKLRTLQFRDTLSQNRNLALALDIDHQRLKVKQAELQLSILLADQQKFATKQAAQLLKQETQRASIQTNIGRNRVSKVDRTKERSNIASLDRRIVDLRQKQAEITITSEAKRNALVSETLVLETNIQALTKARNALKNKALKTTAEEADLVRVTSILRNEAGALSRKNAALRQKEGSTDLKFSEEILKLEGERTALVLRRTARAARGRSLGGKLVQFENKVRKDNVLLSVEENALGKSIANNQRVVNQAVSETNNLRIKSHKILRETVGNQKAIVGLSSKIVAQEQKLAAQRKKNEARLTRGAAFQGAAIGISIAAESISQSLRDIGEEGDESFKVAADAASDLGSALTTMAIVGGPLGLVLAGIQAIGTAQKIFRGLGQDATKSLEGARAAAKKVSDELRAVATAFSTIEGIASRAELGKALSVDDFQSIGDEMTKVAESTGIAVTELATFRDAIGDAVGRGDLTRVRELRKEMTRFSTLRGVASGRILNPQDIKDTFQAFHEANLQMETSKDQLDTIKNKLDFLGGRAAGVGGAALIWFAGKETEKQLEAAKKGSKEARKALDTYGDAAINAFRASADASLTAQENLSNLGPQTIDLINHTERLAEVYDILFQKQGFKRQISVGNVVRDQVAEEAALVQKLGERYTTLGGDLRGINSIFGEFEETQNANINAGIQVSKGLLDNETRMKSAVAAFQDLTGKDEAAARQAIIKDIKDLNGGLVYSRGPTGEALITWKALGQTWALASNEGQRVAIALAGFTTVMAVNNREQTDWANQMAGGSILLQSFENRLTAVATIINDTSTAFKGLADAVSEGNKKAKTFATAFPAQSFRAPTEGLDAMLAMTLKTDQALTTYQITLKQVEQISKQTGLVISDEIRGGLTAGGEAAQIFDARIIAVNKSLMQAQDISKRFGETQKLVGEINTGGLGFQARELQTFTRQRLIMEELAQAIAGFAVVRAKLSSTPAGGHIFREDITQAGKYLDVIERLAGTDTTSIRKAFNAGTIDRKAIENEMTGLLQTVGKNVSKIQDPIVREAVLELTRATMEATNKAVSQGGQSTGKNMVNFILVEMNRLREEGKKPVEAFMKAFDVLAKQARENLSKTIDITKDKLGQLTKAIQTGGFIPDFAGKDLKTLEDQFTRIREAASFQKDLLQRELDEVDIEIIKSQARQGVLKRKGLNVGDNQAKFNREQANLTKLVAQQQTKKQEIANSDQEIKLLGVDFVKIVSGQIGQVQKAQAQLFRSQDAFVQSSATLASKRAEFDVSETTSLNEKLAILEQQSTITRALLGDISGFGETLDIEGIASKITDLTNTLIEGRRKGLSTVAQQALQLEISQEQRKFTLAQRVNTERISTLQKELDIINKQKAALEGFATEFLRSGDVQQKQVISAARATDQFFGKLTPKALDSTEFTKAASSFLRETTDEMRNAVISQLERLKNISGEVAPGVRAEDVLNRLTQGVVGALFKSPQQKLLEEQKALQERMLSVMKDSNAITEVQNRLQIQQTNAIIRSVTALISGAAGGTTKLGEDAQKEALVLKNELGSGLSKIQGINKARTDSENKLVVASQAATISNKAFVDQFSQIKTGAKGSAKSMAELQKELVGLRGALVTAEDKMMDSQANFQEAMGRVGDALIAVSVAQAQFAMGISLSERESMKAVGSFATFHEELNFLGTTFNQHILALQRVGAGEQAISDLRVKLAQEQLSVVERQINEFRSLAEGLFTGGAEAGANIFEASRAAGAAASTATQIGIRPGEAVTAEQEEALFRALIQLPNEVRASMLEGFDQAEAIGQTIGGFGGDELRRIIVGGAGGGGEGQRLADLQLQAAEQRKIIAENSIGQLFSARQGVIKAEEQLQTSREQLLEAKAHRDLAQMQLDALTQGFGDNIRAIDVLANNMVALSKPRSAQNAARGTLSGGEVAGLLNAASREKLAMPTGSSLGVFNTSETVFTRKQMHRLRSGASTPNAQDGTAVIADQETITLLREIATRLAQLQGGGVTQQIQVDITNNRRVSVEGMAGLQTALQEIITDRTGDLYTRQEAEAVEQVLETIMLKMRETGQLSAIGT